ncbi:hypothetical protein [Brevibacillus laterosporus]|uniref:hypothetical protein n=1 Tax=Brevibacillus laterosporus TaxID=1465 RepID=UPI000E6C773D|nr:hypothetical protein [Brevibacillus laterosporus]AYB38538.1 hypothetical protein D5F52_09845 [Brevibacillus laterosporus]MBM7110718.1 hypothetical protein [Brevibacillus laterosporus]
MKNNPFEYIQKIQAKINKMNLPAFQGHLDYAQNNDVFKPLIQTDIPQPFKDVLENRGQNKNITDSILTTNESIHQLHEMVKKISHPLPLQIPDSIYPSLDELSSTLLDVLPKKEHADLSAPIIEVPSDPQESLELWTWEKLKWFLEIIIPIIITWHLSNVGSEQLDRHHKEDLQQRERHHQELLIEEQKQTRLLEERIEHEKRLTDALNNVTKAIDQYISESPDDPKVDQSDSSRK